MPALDQEDAEHRVGDRAELFTRISSVLCSWLSPAANLYLQTLEKHPVPSAVAPTLAEGSGPAYRAGVSRWQDSTGIRKNSLFPMKSGRGLSVSALSLPVGRRKGLQRCVVGEQRCHPVPHPLSLSHRRTSTS